VTIIYLVRHGAHALVNEVLCGRRKGVSLSAEGVNQAAQLGALFAEKSIDLVQSSPRRRARETAGHIARATAREVDVTDDMDELDTGEWTGRSFASLAFDAGWKAWNKSRGSARPPGGESMAELQGRVLRHVEMLKESKASSVVVVTHAEPIRGALLHYRRMSLDRFAEIVVAPASVSILRSDGDRLRAGEINLRVRP
jgi:probable phosphoglycerate mutase